MGIWVAAQRILELVVNVAKCSVAHDHDMIAMSDDVSHGVNHFINIIINYSVFPQCVGELVQLPRQIRRPIQQYPIGDG